MNTNYLVLNPTTKVYQDLSQIFVRRSPTAPMSPPTGITFYNTETGENDDINTIFYPLTEGMLKLPYNTNITTSNSTTKGTKSSYATDITNVSASQPISVADYKKYTLFYDDKTSFYTVVFVSNGYSSNASTITNDQYTATLTFTVDVNNVQWTVVGGGGGGGNGSSTCKNDYGGGGGAGGSVTTNTSLKAYLAGTTYDIVVGAGGNPKKAGGMSSVTPSSGAAGTIYQAPGGAYGMSVPSDQCSYVSGGKGANGGGSGGQSGLDGKQGSYLTIMSGGIKYYFAGGGAGGSPSKNYIAYGGVGGGQGGCAGTSNTYTTGIYTTGNNNSFHEGPNYMYYAQGIQMASGYPGTGGGGAGGSNNNGDNYAGCQGGSGTVICTFKVIS